MRASRSDSVRAKVVHPLQWLWEPLENDVTFVLRSMFGAKAVYLDGKLMLCFCHGEEPWHGVLVCTDRAQHASLLADLPALAPHAVLPKWLYVSTGADDFDRTATRIVELVRRRDSRLGVTPKPRRQRKKKERPV